MWDTISQIAIFTFGVTAVILVAKKNKWGFVFGLIAQPFWYITGFLHQQWGIVLISVVYTFSWLLGIYEWFYKDKKKKKSEYN